jgi:hypothetical protein
MCVESIGAYCCRDCGSEDLKSGKHELLIKYKRVKFCEKNKDKEYYSLCVDFRKQNDITALEIVFHGTHVLLLNKKLIKK